MKSSECILEEFDLFGEKVYLVDDYHSNALIKFLTEKQAENDREDESFYMFNIGDIIEKVLLWKLSFPDIQSFYAVKCNPYPLLLKILAYMGVNFDCASWLEITSAMSVGACGDRIIYANPCKYKEFLKMSSDANINCMTFDSEDEIIKMHSYQPNAECVLRFYVSTSNSRCPLGLKFGAPLDAIPHLIRKCKDLKMDLCGLSFHVGSGCYESQVYEEAIRTAKEIFDLAESYGFKLWLLDIGGGFPGDLEYPESMDLFIKCRGTINQAIATYFKDINPKIIAEPGRFFATSAMKLACSVVGVKREYNRNAILRCYYLNDSVHSSFNCINFDHYIGASYLVPKGVLEGNSVKESEESYETIFYGITGEKHDIIMPKTNFKKVAVGDLVIYKNMGAYTMCAVSQYKGMSIPFVYNLIQKSSLKLLQEYGLLEKEFVDKFLI